MGGAILVFIFPIVIASIRYRITSFGNIYFTNNRDLYNIYNHKKNNIITNLYTFYYYYYFTDNGNVLILRYQY